jgi:hypothetical protein
MSAYVDWLKRGLNKHLARRVSLDNLELIIENGRAFNVMRDALVSRYIYEHDNTWAKTQLTKDMFQLLPIDYKSVSFPSRYCVATYAGGLGSERVHCLAKLFMKHPYVRQAGDDCTRFILFGQRPENMLILAVHTDRRSSSNSPHLGGGAKGRTHKAYVLGNQWINYDISLPGPTMGYKIR